jgi:hypothetical protein
LWTGDKLGLFSLTDIFKQKLAPTSVVFLKATLPVDAQKTKQKTQTEKIDF